MKTKIRDRKWCSVDAHKIINANPELNWVNVYHFKRFVIDRYRVHKRKDISNLPAPWTKNPVIKEFKFTNVRREHDRQTRYLIDNITHNPELTLEDKIVNTFLFRSWNNWSTLKDFGFPYPSKRLYDPKLKEKVRPRYKKLSKAEPDRLWYNNAYNQGGTKHAWKFPAGDGYQRAYKESEAKKYSDWEADIPLRPFHVGVWLGQQNIVDKLLKAKDQQEAFDIIKSVRGFADFLAYQVFVDLTYIEDFPFSENEFVIAGPGCKRGLDYIFKDRDGMSYEECIFWLRDHINADIIQDYTLPGLEYSIFNCDELAKVEDRHEIRRVVYEPIKLFNDLPEYDRCMNVMSIENCMCELSKYIRAVEGTGRPRNKYKPTIEPTIEPTDIDRYPGETEDILKKIREAGE